jgi:small subunit ribosomal protein S9
LPQYFRSSIHERTVEEPLELVSAAGLYDLRATVEGGGHSGQAGAIRLGVSRCLARVDEKFHKALRKEGFLTRDAREVERKKYGRSGARKRYQFSKR